MGRLLKTSEVCEILRIDRMTLYRWIRSGKIKAIKIGWKWLIPEEEVEKIIRGNC